MLLAIAKNLLGKGKSDEEKPLDEMSDEDLMLSYADGNVGAFEVIVSRHEKPLFHFILRSCGNRDRAEEILQEVFLRVIKYSDNYKPTAKFTTWVYTIARNLCIDKARKRSRATEISLDQPRGSDPDGQSLGERLADGGASAAPVEYDRSAFREKLMAALDELPDEQREVFMLREFSGLKYREIAEAVGVKVPTVKSRMRYALQALRGHLADYIDHSFDREERQEIAVPEE
ncbi:RNA polymerase sigma factor [Persicimonas caeni]|uniref:RNA polymerase sigma factor n=1 Tax=Persicimonas caeni TaxID=2292766 RepID=A0A4Y6PW21_PERCE|nr:RNA polymerase sigma factor [Persicimonas caeni]QDG52508.1 RNA polymerase sigma factor [Persicimonas caeni]QED33730.1 RNA polymerase sigma factor [Persicimonas caeni]